MKFNRKNPYHYFIYISYTLFFFFSLFLVAFKKTRNNTIYLMGHKLGGNLQSLLESQEKIEYDFKYLTFDKYLIKNNDYCISYLSIKNIVNLLSCKIIIATHGILFHKIIKGRKIKTVNIGHGVQTIVIDKNSSGLSLFDEVWLSSNFDKNILVNKCNYNSNNLFTTGFIKHKVLLENERVKDDIKINENLKYNYWLYAPTASSKKINEEINIFHSKNINFLNEINKISKENNYITIIKPHYNDYIYKKNDQEVINFIKSSSNLIYFKDLNLDNEEYLLNISDLLITDWSSIYLDFLILNKPIVFLDSPKRRGNIKLSEYFDNNIIKRCKTYEEFENTISNLINNKIKNVNNDLKTLIFENFDFDNIDMNYRKRMEKLNEQ